MTLILMIYETDVCNIWYIYGLYMNKIAAMYQYMIHVRFQQGSEGVQRYQNSLHFKFSPISVEGGGSSKINFFPNSKKSKLSQGGGGSRKLWTFSTNYGIFYFEPSPKLYPHMGCQKGRLSNHFQKGGKVSQYSGVL